MSKAFAIACSMKKRAKKMAKGGDVKGAHESIMKGDAGTSVAGANISGHGYGNNPDTAKRIHKEKLAELKSMPKPNIKGLAHGGEVDEEASGYVMHPEDEDMHNSAAMHKDEEMDNEDMVGKILRKRMLSKGGEVANNDHEFEAEFHEPDNFDDLTLRDGLEEHYTGANSGDELSDAQEDKDRNDIVKKIMSSLAKKDRMPRPA